MEGNRWQPKYPTFVEGRERDVVAVVFIREKSENSSPPAWQIDGEKQQEQEQGQGRRWCAGGRPD